MLLNTIVFIIALKSITTTITDEQDIPAYFAILQAELHVSRRPDSLFHDGS